MDDSDGAGPINGGRIGLRALWGVFPVAVRVHSSAFAGTGQWLLRPLALDWTTAPYSRAGPAFYDCYAQGWQVS
jgi:hypothetical protein